MRLVKAFSKIKREALEAGWGGSNLSYIGISIGAEWGGSNLLFSKKNQTGQAGDRVGQSFSK